MMNTRDDGCAKPTTSKRPVAVGTPTRLSRVVVPLRTERVHARRRRRPSVPVSFWREPELAQSLVWNVGDVLEISETTMVLATSWYAVRGTRVQMRMLAGTELYAFDAHVARSLELMQGGSRIHLGFDRPQPAICAALRGLSHRRGLAA